MGLIQRASQVWKAREIDTGQGAKRWPQYDVGERERALIGQEKTENGRILVIRDTCKQHPYGHKSSLQADNILSSCRQGFLGLGGNHAAAPQT